MAKAKSRKYLHEHLPGSTEVIEQMLQTAKPIFYKHRQGLVWL
jgi:hypothetical protein